MQSSMSAGSASWSAPPRARSRRCALAPSCGRAREPPRRAPPAAARRRWSSTWRAGPATGARPARPHPRSVYGARRAVTICTIFFLTPLVRGLTPAERITHMSELSPATTAAAPPLSPRRRWRRLPAERPPRTVRAPQVRAPQQPRAHGPGGVPGHVRDGRQRRPRLPGGRAGAGGARPRRPPARGCAPPRRAAAEDSRVRRCGAGTGSCWTS